MYASIFTSKESNKLKRATIYSQELRTLKITVGHDNCWLDVGCSGFTVSHANHMAENTLTASPWQGL
jgi:hypothetical protein